MTPEEKEDELALIVARLVADIKTEFGPLPLLRGEDAARYDRILFDIVWAFLPADFIARMLCRDIANAVWFDLRLDRLSQASYDLLLRDKIARHSGRPGLPQPMARADEKSTGVSEHNTGNDLVELERVEENELRGQSFHELSAHLRIQDDLKTTNFYRRNISLQLNRDYKPRSMTPAYMIRKEYIARAEAEMAERDARFQRVLGNEPAKDDSARKSDVA